MIYHELVNHLVSPKSIKSIDYLHLLQSYPLDNTVRRLVYNYNLPLIEESSSFCSFHMVGMNHLPR